MWVAIALGCRSNGSAPCGIEDGLEVLDATADQPWNENELSVDVQLSSPASVAVACTSASDPSEVHLAETTVPATSHQVRIPGLLAASDYDCVAAPVCPEAASAARFSVHTSDAAEDLPEVVTTTLGDAGTDYVLFNHASDCNAARQRLIVIDRDGRVRWWYSTPPFVGESVEFRYHGADQFAWGGAWNPNLLGRPRKLDLYDGETYDSAAALPDVQDSLFHHDGKQLPDGRLLTLEEVAVEDEDGGVVDGFRVRRIDVATDTVDFDYHSQRAYDEGHLPGGDGDVWHANWVDIVDETLYVSLCFVDRVVAIDVPTGRWSWTFGPDGDFDLFDEQGDPLGDDGFPDCQHGLEYRSDGHLLAYDNGVERGYSQVTEYVLDTTAMTATRLWSWTEDDWYETTLGDADYLPNGHVLVTAGHSECFSSNPGDRTTIYEVDPVGGEKVWEMRYTALAETAYRADAADACTLFGNAKYCTAIRDRLDVIGELLAR